MFSIFTKKANTNNNTALTANDIQNLIGALTNQLAQMGVVDTATRRVFSLKHPYQIQYIARLLNPELRRESATRGYHVEEDSDKKTVVVTAWDLESGEIQAIFTFEGGYVAQTRYVKNEKDGTRKRLVSFRKVSESEEQRFYMLKKIETMTNASLVELMEEELYELEKSLMGGILIHGALLPKEKDQLLAQKTYAEKLRGELSSDPKLTRELEINESLLVGA